MGDALRAELFHRGDPGVEAVIEGVARSSQANVFRADAGEAITITFTAPAAGTYQVICNVPGHFSAGMEGLLTVTGA